MLVNTFSKAPTLDRMRARGRAKFSSTCPPDGALLSGFELSAIQGHLTGRAGCPRPRTRHMLSPTCLSPPLSFARCPSLPLSLCLSLPLPLSLSSLSLSLSLSLARPRTRRRQLYQGCAPAGVQGHSHSLSPPPLSLSICLTIQSCQSSTCAKAPLRPDSGQLGAARPRAARPRARQPLARCPN